jgi:hypothetical protein
MPQSDFREAYEVIENLIIGKLDTLSDMEYEELDAAKDVLLDLAELDERGELLTREQDRY